MEHGKRLNPERSLRTPKEIKGTRQKVIVTHNPSEIDQAQELLVRFPDLGSDDVIIPGTVNLSFNIELSSTVDANRTLVSNIGRAIVKKLAVKFEGNEIMSVDNFDIFACYRDLWKTNASVNSKHQHLPGLTPGEFFKVVKFPAPGQKLFAKLRPRGKKIDKNPTPGDNFVDLQDNFAMIVKPSHFSGTLH